MKPSFTATLAAAALDPSLQATGGVPLAEFRAQHAGLEPWKLATVPAEGGRMVECVSYPWTNTATGRARIMARDIIGDATTVREYDARDLRRIRRSAKWHAQYRAAFAHGWECCIAEIQRMRRESAGGVQ